MRTFLAMVAVGTLAISGILIGLGLHIALGIHLHDDLADKSQVIMLIACGLFGCVAGGKVGDVAENLESGHMIHSNGHQGASRSQAF